MKEKLLVKFGDFIVKIRYIMLPIFLCLFVIGIININNVKVNDSIVSYLPKDTETKYGLDIMDDEFGSLSTIKLMLPNKDNISDYKNQILSLDNVDNVMVTQNNDNVLFTIHLIDSKKSEVLDVKDKIEDIVSDYEYSIYSEDFENPTDGITEVLIVSCIIIVIILLITSKTYFEVVIAFIIFALSIVLNMGSNFLLGEISYITKSIAVILQLALSIDYVIIYMNQYMKEVTDTPDKLLAIKKTTSKAMPEIFASSLTTISGLMALIFMQLKIGGDIGIVLSKGIGWSLLTVIFVIPSLLDLFTKQILKFRKKSKIKNANKIGDIIFKGRKVLLPLFLVLIVIAVFLLPKYNYVYDLKSARAFRLSDNIKALDNIEKEFGNDNMLVILVKNNNKDYSKELEFANKLGTIKDINSVTSIGNYKIAENLYLGSKINYHELSSLFDVDENQTISLYKYYANEHKEVEKLNNIDEYKISIIDLLYFLHNKTDLLDQKLAFVVTAYYDTLSSKISLLESDNYTRFILNLDTQVEGVDTTKLIDEVRSISNSYYNDVTLVGNSINASDLKSTFTSDNIIITFVTILFIAIILLFTFKSFGATILLILTIEGSILINFGIVTLLGVNIFFMSYVVVSAIQMGATIDYAIVIASRYIALRKKMDKKEAIVQTLNDRLPAVITSGLILLLAGFLVAFIATSSVISQIGLFLGIGTLISLVATIFVLPAILYVCDKFILKTTFGKNK